MKFTLFAALAIVALLAACPVSRAQQFDDDNGDFAEFDDFEEDAVQQPVTPKAAPSDAPKAATPADAKKSPTKHARIEQADDFYGEDDDEDAVVRDEDSEFEHFQDDEEFEGYQRPEAETAVPVPTAKPSKASAEPKLTMAKVPMHFRTHWESYWLEILIASGLVVYFTNYLFGRSKNSRLAQRWVAAHRKLLEDNFMLIGDWDAGRPSVQQAPDADEDTADTKLIEFSKESESLYTLWCSGRMCCEGMLIELKMIKRQDLLALAMDLVRPTQDQLHIKVEVSKDSMDSFVFAVASKRTGSRLFKEMADLNKYCVLVSKPDEKYGVPAGFAVLSEIAEASAAVLDGRVCAALTKYAAWIDYIHVSDQFSGPVQQDDPSVLKQPETRRMLMCGFTLPKCRDGQAYEETTSLLVLVFYLLERLRRYRLSKEGKAKADKNRARVEEEFLKSTSVARAEAAAVRRDEKRKQEKEKILAEEDPEKQRRWEQKEQKRQAKKKQPKMKQLSVKAF